MVLSRALRRIGLNVRQTMANATKISTPGLRSNGFFSQFKWIFDGFKSIFLQFTLAAFFLSENGQTEKHVNKQRLKKGSTFEQTHKTGKKL